MKIGNVISRIVSYLSLEVTSESAISAEHDEYCDEDAHARKMSMYLRKNIFFLLLIH